MEGIEHSMLEGGCNVLESKGRDMIGKSVPRCGKRNFIMMLRVDLNLIVVREAIYEG